MSEYTLLTQVTLNLNSNYNQLLYYAVLLRMREGLSLYVGVDNPFSPLFVVYLKANYLDCHTICNSDRMAEQAPINFRFGYVRLLQDEPLGTGAYGQVCKAMLGELPCAAKLLHPVLIDPNKPRNREMFERECRFLSEIRHPNIVQYLGVAQDPQTGLPILLMELMDDSLTHFLELSETRLPYHVQVNINCDISQALTFLHSNQVLHRDLSSNNVLLIGAGVRAKVTDFGMSKLTAMNPRMTSLTKCPGTAAYMSPEALLDPPIYTEKLDCFQAGVLMVQIITRKFPDPSDAMRRMRDARFPSGWGIIQVPEADRRHNHLSLIPNTHPILPIAMDCLKDTDTERPSAQQICRRLLALKDTPEYKQYKQSLETREGERDGEIEERDQLIQQLRQETDEKEREIREKEREAEEEKQRLTRRLGLMSDQMQQTLDRRRQVENELRDEIHELRESNTRLLQEKEREKEQEKVELLRQHELVLREKDRLIRHLQSQQLASYTCHVSGPGLQSATANHPTHVIVELTDSSNRPCSVPQKVTAQLELISKATPTSGGRWPWSKKEQNTKPQAVHAAVATTSPSRYEVSYTAISRGQHKLYVRLNDIEINGSPFTITVYPDPTQLAHPVRVVTDLNFPFGVAVNSRGEMIVSECGGDQIAVFDIGGQRIRTFGSPGDSPEQMTCPKGIAIDDMDNIYVTSYHKLQKFTSSGELIKCVGQVGSKEGEFNDPHGLALHNNQVYVCDRDNHRIQVFDLDLNFIRSIGSRGKGRGEFDGPLDVKFDKDGYMYIAELSNKRVQVLDRSGHFMRVFGEEGKGKLCGPTALHIVDKYVYVSDHLGHCIVVYETSGQFVTSFGVRERRGQKNGEFSGPNCITPCTDGFIHVCDYSNKRVQIF